LVRRAAFPTRRTHCQLDVFSRISIHSNDTCFTHRNLARRSVYVSIGSVRTVRSLFCPSLFRPIVDIDSSSCDPLFLYTSSASVLMHHPIIPSLHHGFCFGQTTSLRATTSLYRTTQICLHFLLASHAHALARSIIAVASLFVRHCA